MKLTATGGKRGWGQSPNKSLYEAKCYPLIVLGLTPCEKLRECGLVPHPRRQPCQIPVGANGLAGVLKVSKR